MRYMLLLFLLGFTGNTYYQLKPSIIVCSNGIVTPWIGTSILLSNKIVWHYKNLNAEYKLPMSVSCKIYYEDY